ncbi:MAG TPA: hypothetical protein VFZ65_23780 [Planctomycetota bacterium]|nr:hypothetical protein [Planctomycetota bacterium]
MKRALGWVVVVVATAAVAGVVVLRAWSAPAPPDPIGADRSAARTNAAAAPVRESARGAAGDVAEPHAREGVADAVPRSIEEARGNSRRSTDGPAWPIRTNGKTAGSQPAAAAPVVPVALAFQALRYVGIDRAAESTWLRAIEEPSTPPQVRSDLIEDLNQEGYHDNGRPTKDDLPLLLARLRLIERLAPGAKDEVAASAFAEAYKDLLEMYVRLGGELPQRR